jgi:hypothetical protein
VASDEKRLSTIQRSVDLIKKGARYVTQVTHGELLEVGEAALESFAALFDAKYEWSKKVIGPNRSPKGLADHIRKELLEIEAKPEDLVEWVDVAMIAMDGAARFAGANGAAFVRTMREKHEANLARDWPDWKTVDPDVPIEHVREPVFHGIDALIAGETPPDANVEELRRMVGADRPMPDALAEMTADRDRWVARNKVLEERLARITNIASGRGA